MRLPCHATQITTKFLSLLHTKCSVHHLDRLQHLGLAQAVPGGASDGVHMHTSTPSCVRPPAWRRCEVLDVSARGY